MADTVEKNPLILIYQSLDKSDCRRLGKWLDSPAHNQRDDVRALHAYLVGGKRRVFKTSALTKTRLWKQLFPNTAYNDARLRQTFHWALRATEAFLGYENWSQEAIRPQLALINELNRRRIPNAIERSIKQGWQLQEKTDLRNETYFRYQYLLEQESDYYREFFHPRAAPHFQEVADNLDVSYLIEKLRASWNMLFHQRLYRTQYDIRFLDEVAKYVAELDLKKYPVLAIHYYGYRGLAEDDTSGQMVGKLRTAVQTHGDLLSSHDHRHVILMAINLCISNMNQGREAFVREAFEWYRLGLEQDIVAENGRLTRPTYLNIFAIAARLKEFDFAGTFINDYACQLEEDIRDNTERFARARLNYERKDYATAMPLLVQVDFKHPVYNLLAKTLLLKIYFELEEFDALESQVDSMTTYVRRKELSDLHRDNFKNVARLTRQLSRLLPRDFKKKEQLRKKIAETSPLTEKKWLLAQLEAL